MQIPYDGMSVEQLKDVVDAQSLTVGQSEYDPHRYKYYDDLTKYSKALETMGKDPAVSIPHELSHGRCALAVGVHAVQYGIEYDPKWNIPVRAITSIMGPTTIPRIGLAAFSVAPISPSHSDLTSMRRLGYPTVEYLQDRIVRWNQQDNGLTIPLPGTIDVTF